MFAVIGFSRFLIKRYGFRSGLTRHMIHLFAGPSMLLLPLFSDWVYPFTIPLGLAFIVGLGLTVKGSLREVMVDDSKYSRLHAMGPLYYILSILVLVPASWSVKAVGMASVMIMAWGDGAASTIAPKLKRRHQYPWGDKTIEGSILMFMFGFLGASIAWTIGIYSRSPHFSIVYGLWMAFAGAAFGTLVEAITVGPAKPFDNLTVPLSSALVMVLLTFF